MRGGKGVWIFLSFLFQLFRWCRMLWFCGAMAWEIVGWDVGCR